jgi:hypothetical protein
VLQSASPGVRMSRRYTSYGTEELAQAFSTACLSGDAESFAELMDEMGYRRKFVSTIDAFEALGQALLQRDAPRQPAAASDAVGLVHAVLGIGTPSADRDESYRTARRRIDELRRNFHPDRFASAPDPRLAELATRYVQLVNGLAEALDRQSGRR